MKRNNSLLLAAAALAAGTAFAADAFPCRGETAEECVVAVPLDPAVYSRASRGNGGAAREIDASAANALERMLRVVRISPNAAGSGPEKRESIPYSVRPALRRKTETRNSWERFLVADAKVSGDSLTCRVDPPASTNGAVWTALEIATPLRNFEQIVTVKDKSGREIARGTLYDYARFASVRNTTIKFPAAAEAPFELSFASPETEAEAAEFERTLSKGTDGSLSTKEERKSIVRRAFRIDGVSAAVTRQESVFEPEEAVAAPGRPMRVFEDGGDTVIEGDAAFMPVEWIDLDAVSENFSRNVSVEFQDAAGWRRGASGRISSVDLPGEKRRSLRVGLHAPRNPGLVRLRIANDDNPPLEFANPPAVFGVARRDVLFIAKPGCRYELELDRASKAPPKYDDTIRSYIDRVRDPVRWELDVGGAGAGDSLAGDSPAINFVRSKGLAIASAVVFAALLVACIRLLGKK